MTDLSLLTFLVEVLEEVGKPLLLAEEHVVVDSIGLDFGNYFTLFDLNGAQ